MDKSLALLGLAKKAGMLAIGDEPVSKAAFMHKARLVMSASDASDASKRRAERYSRDSGAEYLTLPYAKEELGRIVGRGLPGMLAMLDAGLASKLASELAAVSPEEYADAAETMKHRSERVLRRKKEAMRAARHTGKRRTAQ